MIDLTPLDVRNKRGDFKKLMRGYDPLEVDGFLELAAERLEALTRENMSLKERTQALQTQVSTQLDREQAVQEALVTAQELRTDIRQQSQREADHLIKEAETEGRRLVAEADAEARTRLRGSERRLEQLMDSIQEMERRRDRFLRDFRQLLQRELDVVEVEEERTPLEERTIDLELGSKRRAEVPAQKHARLAPPVVPRHVDPVPPTEATVDDLAAAYERELEAEGVLPVEEARTSTGLDGSETPPTPPAGRRQEDLLLYLDADDGEARG